MAFIDELNLHIKAGNGGAGVVRWLHEKGKEFMGPAGGNGGRGADVYARAIRDFGVLANYKNLKEIEAPKGADGGNKSFLQNLYISPPGSYSATSNTVSGYYDETTVDFTGATFGTLINLDLQTHLLFRIVTRDPDTSNVLKPVNVY